ncbi:MAG: CHAT domain-containing protein [Tolypothrix sp. T3-bin4]|nr:CHAT domain-containing protein [Tolypothrix sp. Co-bin9]MBD0304143.1 CHAT domain-containing protein [Tolypothrix sp. T3-bin4]
MNDSDIPVKILFLAADPSDEARLRLLQELRDIRERLQLSKERDRFKLESRESVRVGDITQVIFDVDPQIVHFSGHGTSTGELHFESLQGKSQLVTADALAALFELVAEKIDCVVLNACYSEIQAQAIAQHIRFVIGMNQAIGDKAAIAFSVGFYKALAANRSIEEAYQFGCVEIQLYNLPEHLKPVIYINRTAKPRVKKILPNPFVPQNGRVEHPQQFFGRQREIQRVFEVLNSGSSVALIAKDGLGKSSLLWEICRVAENRLQQSRQAVFFDLNDVGDEKDFYIALCDKLGIAECKGYKLTRNLRQRDKKVLLALDNVGKITCKGFSRNVRDQLRGLAEGGDAPLRLILAANEPLEDLFNDSHNDGKTSPLAGICQEENIQPWEDAIMRDFIAARLVNTSVRFAEEEIIQLVQESRGHPRKLMQLCYRTYRKYAEGGQ